MYCVGDNFHTVRKFIFVSGQPISDILLISVVDLEAMEFRVLICDTFKVAIYYPVADALQDVVYFGDNKLLELAYIRGEYDSAFDEYFAKIGIKPCETPKRCGYTSWYNYYNRISDEIIDISRIVRRPTYEVPLVSISFF